MKRSNIQEQQRHQRHIQRYIQDEVTNYKLHQSMESNPQPFIFGDRDGSGNGYGYGYGYETGDEIGSILGQLSTHVSLDMLDYEEDYQRERVDGRIYKAYHLHNQRVRINRRTLNKTVYDIQRITEDFVDDILEDDDNHHPVDPSLMGCITGLIKRRGRDLRVYWNENRWCVYSPKFSSSS